MCLLQGMIKPCGACAEVHTSLAAPKCSCHLQMPDCRIILSISLSGLLLPAAVYKAVFRTPVDGSCSRLVQDKKVKGRIDARNSLETYCYNMKTTIEDKLGDQLEDDDKDKVGPYKHSRAPLWCSR